MYPETYRIISELGFHKYANFLDSWNTMAKKYGIKKAAPNPKNLLKRYKLNIGIK